MHLPLAALIYKPWYHISRAVPAWPGALTRAPALSSVALPCLCPAVCAGCAQVYASPVRLVNVEVVGNSRTKLQIFQRATRQLWRATTFGQLMQELGSAQSALQGLDIFESSQITVHTVGGGGRQQQPPSPPLHTYDAPDEVVLKIEVKEKTCTTLKTGTYVNAENAEGNMEGLYVLRNYFGTAERFELSSAMGTSASVDYKFNCFKPTVGDTDVEMHGQVNRATTQYPHSSYHECETKVSAAKPIPSLDCHASADALPNCRRRCRSSFQSCCCRRLVLPASTSPCASCTRGSMRRR
jgi:hypothetical protein|eukprot:SAG25_NODE_232_length_11380_cov_15.425583_7_plen_297_part_00